MAEDFAERTEAPTPKRIREAREKGEVANSRDLSSVVVLAAALLGLGWLLSDHVGPNLARLASEAWGGSLVQPGELSDFHAVMLHGLLAAAACLLPLAALLLLSGVAVSFAQTGPLFSTRALAFRGERIDPIRGFKRLVSLERLVDLAKAPLKVAVVGAALALVVVPHVGGLVALAGAPPAAGLEVLGFLSQRLVRVVLFGLGVLALADLAWVRHHYQRRLRMTRRQVQDEQRDREGSPQVRQRRRQLQRDLSRQRMIAAVAEADVVVTNPTHYAVALRYARESMSAPEVLARGRNHLALRIRQAARSHQIPVVENPPLAQVLYRTTRMGRPIPESLYEAVAEVLAYVYRLDRRRGRAWGAES